MLPDDDGLVMACWLAANPTWLAQIEDHLAREKSRRNRGNAAMAKVMPDPILCPECGAPAVSEEHVAVTLMAVHTFLDSDGRRHIHDPNGSGIVWTCKNGHEWAPSKACWCGQEGW